jgi:hypothetical protein
MYNSFCANSFFYFSGSSMKRQIFISRLPSYLGVLLLFHTNSVNISYLLWIFDHSYSITSYISVSFYFNSPCSLLHLLFLPTTISSFSFQDILKQTVRIFIRIPEKIILFYPVRLFFYLSSLKRCRNIRPLMPFSPYCLKLDLYLLDCLYYVRIFFIFLVLYFPFK